MLTPNCKFRLYLIKLINSISEYNTWYQKWNGKYTNSTTECIRNIGKQECSKSMEYFSGRTEIKYIGHKISKDGIKPDENKIEAITKMPSPRNVKALKRFLGMIGYLAKFIPNLTDETKILRDLEKKNNIFEWTSNH